MNFLLRSFLILMPMTQVNAQVPPGQVTCISTSVLFSDFAAPGSIAGPVGTTILVTCNPGYTGGGPATCLPSGVFSVTPCTANRCIPTQVPFSDHALAGSIFGTTGQSTPVICNAGFSGSGIATCLPTGVFSTIVCAFNLGCVSTQVPFSDHAAAGSIAGPMGATVIVTCNPGYSGGGTVTCQQATGLFTTVSCVANPCTPTQVANSGHATVGSITGTTGQWTNVICNAGYSGGGAATCQNTGLFTTVVCTANACTPAQVANSGHATPGAITGTTGQRVTVVCNVGYSGGGAATCQPTGLFSVTPCTPNPCTSTQVANSDHAALGSVIGATGQIVNVVCNQGYSGGGPATCLPTGLFSVPTCTPIACTPTQVANSGHATPGAITGTTGQTVTVVCNPGFSGGGGATCLPTGLFSVTPCTVNSCTPTQVANSGHAAAGAITGTTGQIVTVVCNLGYTGGGPATCLPTGVFSVTPCTGLPCTATQVPFSAFAATGSLTGVTGQVVNVVCDPGYTGGGPATCQPSGLFTVVTPCAPNTCTATQVPNSGHATPGAISGTTGQVVMVVCNVGFSGGGAATCQPSGVFSVTGCAGNPCTPTQVPNSGHAGTGAITGTSGQTVTVVCNPGFSGGGMTTCQPSGLFTAITPCFANPCTSTQVPNSGHSAPNSISGSTGQTVNIICNAGYSGGGVATCQANGVFSVTQCTANTCTPSQALNSGHAAAGSITGTTGQVVNVVCIPGYSGGGRATCQTNGLFSTIAPCTPNACTPTQVVNSDKSAAGAITGTTGQTVNVICNAGYSGGGLATCRVSGSFGVTACTANTCTATQAANSDQAALGSITGSTGQTVPIVCNAGYTGGGVATCQPTGLFSFTPCTPNACTSTAVANSDRAALGSIIGTTWQTVNVICNAGHSGGGAAVCQPTGLFTVTPCTPNACTPTQVANSGLAAPGAITGTTGQVVNVICNPGYSGGGAATCQTTGSFSVFPCTANPCRSSEVAFSDHAALSSVFGTTGQSVTVICDAGYTGGGITTCQPTGLFTTITPCTPNSCTPTQVANSDHAALGSIIGTTWQSVPVVCDPGFSGGGAARCLPTGLFSVTPCTPNICRSFQVPNSGHATPGAITGTTGQIVNVVCNPGYSGGGAATCLPSGDFSVTSCTANACTATEVVNSGFAALGSITGKTGQVVNVVCNAGYSGGGPATCQATGLFSVVPPCTPNACASTAVPFSDHALAGSIAGTTGQTVTVSCNTGYIGGGVVTCLDTGVFTTVTCTFVLPNSVLTGINVVTCTPTPLAPCTPPVGVMAMVTPGGTGANVNLGFPAAVETYLVPMFQPPAALTTWVSNVVTFQSPTPIPGLTDLAQGPGGATFRYLQTFAPSLLPPKSAYITSIAMFRSTTPLPLPTAGNVYYMQGTTTPLQCPLGPCQYFTSDINVGRNQPTGDYLYIGWTTAAAPPLRVKALLGEASEPQAENTSEASGSNSALYGLLALAVVPAMAIAGAVFWAYRVRSSTSETDVLDNVFVMDVDDATDASGIVKATPIVPQQETMDATLL